MKKDIFDMLNDSDINLDDYEKEEMNDIEKMKMKKFAKKMTKKKKGFKFTKVAGICAAVGAGFLITPFGQDVIASINLPSFEFEELLGIDKDLSDYKTVVNQSVTDKGVTIKLNEVIFDENMLRVFSTIYVEDNGKKYTFASGDEIIYINGEKSLSGIGGGLRKVAENTFVSEMDHFIDLEKIDLSKPLDIEIKIKDVKMHSTDGSEKDKSVKGNWNFKFTVDPSEIIADTKIQEPNIVLAEGEQTVTIEKFTSNKAGQKMYAKYGENTLIDSDLLFVGTDNLGNPVEFGLRSRNDKEAMFEIYKLEGGLSDEATEITLQAAYVDYPDGADEIQEEAGELSGGSKNFGEPFTIKLK